MNKNIRRIVPLILAICIIICIGWYLFIYDRTFTRDVLLNCARFFDSNGNTKIASLCYNRAYVYSGNDEEVAIELANQYKEDGNYTKAEVTLTNAIADGGAVELYIALCKTYVEQDKLLDAVTMLDKIADPTIKAQLDALRPAAPVADPAPGFYSQYITVSIPEVTGNLYCSTNGEYPSIQKDRYTEPITLGSGETTMYAIHVANNGLTSPVTVLAYTINGVIEPAVFTDSAVEAEVRNLLGVDETKQLYTNDLWEIKEFTLPAEAQSLEDLNLFSYLEKLTIPGKKLTDLSPLTSLPRLQEVDLSGCRFPSSDLLILAKLPSLTKLNLSNCGLSTVADLEGAASLTSLDLSNNTVQKMDALASIATLQELYLQHNAVIDLSALSSLSNLTKLDVSYNAITDLSPLASLTELSWLDASHNSLTKLSALDKLPALRYLALNHNQLTNIALLSNCSALAEIYVSNNSIGDVTCLSNMANIEVLDFSYNEIYHIPMWNNGGALRQINGSHNHIASIDTLWRLENLTYIYMDYNNIESLNFLERCSNLVLINVYGNRISNVSHLTSKGIIVNYNPA